MKAPLISVVVPVYKTEAVLSRCIESILRQSYSDFELLLIDDGSPDRSGEVCEEYAMTDVRIHVFHQQNSGVSVARNRGVKEAIGEYILFIDSDDWIAPDFFSTLSTHLGRYDILFFGGQSVSDTGDFILEQRPEAMDTSRNSLSDIVFSMFKIGLLGYMWSMAIRRTLITDNSISFKKGISIHEDSLFCYHCLLVTHHVISLDIVPYRYVIYKTVNTLSKLTPAIYGSIAIERISLMEKLLDTLHTPTVEKDYILSNMKYWAWGRCLDWACEQPEKIKAINKIMLELSGIRSFSVYSNSGRLMRFCISVNNPYLLLLGKKFSKLIK